MGQERSARGRGRRRDGVGAQEDSATRVCMVYRSAFRIPHVPLHSLSPHKHLHLPSLFPAPPSSFSRPRTSPRTQPLARVARVGRDKPRAEVSDWAAAEQGRCWRWRGERRERAAGRAPWNSAPSRTAPPTSSCSALSLWGRLEGGSPLSGKRDGAGCGWMWVERVGKWWGVVGRKVARKREAELPDLSSGTAARKAESQRSRPRQDSQRKGNTTVAMNNIRHPMSPRHSAAPPKCEQRLAAAPLVLLMKRREGRERGGGLRGKEGRGKRQRMSRDKPWEQIKPKRGSLARRWLKSSGGLRQECFPSYPPLLASRESRF